jgi:hypothetical protein
MYDLRDPSSYQPPEVRGELPLSRQEAELQLEVVGTWLYLPGAMAKLADPSLNGQLSIVASEVESRRPVWGWAPKDWGRQDVLYDLKRAGSFSAAVEHFRAEAKRAGWRGANADRKATLAACELMRTVPNSVREDAKLWPEKARRDLSKIGNTQQHDVATAQPGWMQTSSGARGPAEKYPFRTLPLNGTFKVSPDSSRCSWKSFRVMCAYKSSLLGRKFRCHKHDDGTFEVWREE